MIVSEARRQANLTNSLKSSGPRDTSRSRANALKHGLTAKVLDASNLTASIPATLEGEANAEWLADQITLTQSRIDLCGKMEIQARDRAVFRAKHAWDDDRRTEADKLGAKLHKDPAGILAKLKESVQGCQHLIDRWTRMTQLTSFGAWGDVQTSVIYDLLGVVVSERSTAVRADRHFETLLKGEFRNCGDLAQAQIAKLQARVEELRPRDAYDRALVESGNSDEPGVEVRRYRRYESALYSRLKWCLKQLATDVETKPTEPDPSTAPDDETKPFEAEAEPERSQSPPVSDRIAAREAKAEANRQAKLRKLGRRRA